MGKGDRWVEELYRIVGDSISRIRKNRTPKPLTQQELAERTGGKVSRSSIANIERGLQHVSLAQLYLLANALDVEVSDLLPARQDVLGIVVGSFDLTKTKKPLSEKDRAWLEKVAFATPTKGQKD
jgi:transcriptional regulator with XRE-family HTH domain